MTESTDIAGSVAVNALSELFKYSLSGVDSTIRWVRNKDLLGLAAKKYLSQLEYRYGSMRILGMDRPVPLRSIYVRVNLLERVTSRSISSIDELEGNFDYETRRIRQTNITVRGEDLVSNPQYRLSGEKVKQLRERRSVPNSVIDVVADVKDEAFQSKSALSLYIKQQLGVDEYRKHSKPILECAETFPSNYVVLGKPGAGKTTFLKYLMFSALDEPKQQRRIPIYINLNDFSDSTSSLISFAARQFDVCELPDSERFLTYLLKTGRCIVLLDGLDEVREEKEAMIISQINEISDYFYLNQYIISCRVAAYSHNFPLFSDVEISDFDENQIKSFVNNWFRTDPSVAGSCWKRLSEKREISELAKTPLLLTLLCLAFEENLEFPANRAELYKEGVDALLKKWDSSRRISRSEIYRHLSTPKKEMMLSEIAHSTFINREYFLPQRVIELGIRKFIENLPDVNKRDLDLDSEAILRAVEAQHGLLVERARGIYSFSHLTFQEYLTAKFIVDNTRSGSLENLINKHLLDDRWREVVLLTAGMLPRADAFIELLRDRLLTLSKSPAVSEIQRWSRSLARGRSPYSALMTNCLAFIYIVYAVPCRNREDLLQTALEIGRGIGKISGETYLSNKLGYGNGFGLGRKFFRAVSHKDLGYRWDRDNSGEVRGYAISGFSDPSLLDHQDTEHFFSIVELLLQSLNAEAYVSRNVREEAMRTIFG